MSLVKIIETDPHKHFSTDSVPLIRQPLSPEEVQAAVERGYALRAQYIGMLAHDFYRFLGSLTDRISHRHRSNHLPAHGTR